MKDEQAMTDAFEAAVGGPDAGFRLMRLYQDCRPRLECPWDILSRVAETKEQVFRRRAIRDGYSAKAIRLFLQLQ